jgi:hypothetical protein
MGDIGIRLSTSVSQENPESTEGLQRAAIGILVFKSKPPQVLLADPADPMP